MQTLQDEKIVELFWNREEAAIWESERQYGKYCYAIAFHVLRAREDSDECVNDTWLRAWNAIPPQRPKLLQAFLGRITRNLAFDRFRAWKTGKRGSGEILLVLEELEECVPAAQDTEETVEDWELERVLGRFLQSLPERDCGIFLERYWYSKSVREISRGYSLKESSIKSCLFRSREKLRVFLEEEGVRL